MKRLALILLTLAVLATPAAASTPNAKLKAQLRTQKAKVVRLQAQLAKLATDDTVKLESLASQLAIAQSDLETRTGERDAANAALTTTTANLAAQKVLTTSAATGALAGLSPDQLWAVLGALYPLMPNSDLCGYGRSFYASGNYTSYSFTRYICT